MWKSISRSPRLPVCLLAATAGLVVVTGASADTDLTKAYPAVRCDPYVSDKAYDKSLHGYGVVSWDGSVVCPINRDGTEVDGLPAVHIEVVNQELDPTGELDLMCQVFWLKEDLSGTQTNGSAEVIRGITWGKTVTRQGYTQISFSQAADYEMANLRSLTDGGEGTMALMCSGFTSYDHLLQYYVKENQL
jgi:hypothetical protein